jgi:beta-glucosidase
LPPFEEYRISTQTYRFFTGEPLYPFGYGLSYTTFGYSDLKVASSNMEDSVSVSVVVKNTGKVAGDEVIQVYLADVGRDQRDPIRALAGYTRIHLTPGEVKTVALTVGIPAFGKDEKNKHSQFEISVGGGQPRQKIISSSNVLTTKFSIGK